MSSSRPSTRPGTPANGTLTKPPPNPAADQSPFQLDVTKLHSLPSEQQDLYLLTFTADTVRHVEALDAETTTEQQSALKTALFQIINLSQPAPTRVVRNNLARCFTGILTKGSRKILYESINELVAILNASVKEKDLRAKHAAVSCLGAVFEAAGDSAVSLSSLACTTCLKLLKGAANDAGLRGATFKAIGRIVKGIGVAVDEDVGRTIWKQGRKTLDGDKSLYVQIHICGCLEQLVRHTTYFDNSNDFDKLQAALLKTLDSSATAVRHAAASCFATVLAKSYSEAPNKEAVAKMKKPRKAKKPTKETLEDEDEPGTRPSSPVPEKPATALSYSLMEVMKILSTHYCRLSTSNRARAGLAVTYMKVFNSLGESTLEHKYGDITRHLFNDILSHFAFVSGNKYRQLMNRKLVRVILEQGIGRKFGETAQMNAARFLVNDILKEYPQSLKERPEPGKHVLTAALSALTSLFRQLGAAASGIAESVREALLQVLQHPSYTVQIHASLALRAFVLACPQQLLTTVTICMNSVNRELGLLAGPRHSPRRCTGYAHGLASVLSTSSQHQLYGSLDVYARVLQQATGLLKSSGSSDLRISACQLQVAWIMIGGLMSLGPNFVKIHLSQLMMLWKNALPKPMTRENMTQRSMLELSYLAHVRESALASVRAFLAFNQRLLTSDVSRRLSAMLESTVVFLQNLPERKTSDDPSNRLGPSFQLQDYELMTRRRVLQCFTQLLVLSPAGSLESTAQSTILPLAVASFSDSDFYITSSLSAAIASANTAGGDNLWDIGDNYGFGVTGLVRGLDNWDPISRQRERHWSSHRAEDDEIDQTILNPVGAAAEMDGTCCYLQLDAETAEHWLPNPAATETVNAAIAAFALCLPLQTSTVQEGTLEQLTSNLSASSLQKDSARKAAVTVNAALALLTACKVAVGETGSKKPVGDLRGGAVEKSFENLLHTCLKDQSESVRLMSASALGRLCARSADNSFAGSQVTRLTETIVNNREPHVRAGCGYALACIHSQLGGMAAGHHMRSIVGILMSLSADTHPLVHAWALDSLAQVADSAGLNFSGYVTGAIGMLGQLYVSDSHNAETAQLASSNMAVELSLPVTAAIGRGVDAIINVLGPDLQDMSKARDMIMNLVRLLSKEDNLSISLESLRCLDHLSLYAPGHLDFADYVQRLQSDIESQDREISHAALHGLFNLMRRDAPVIVQNAKLGLEERLWDYLNAEPDQEDVRGIFTNWLQQTGSSDPAGWIQRCNAILTKTKSKNEQQSGALGIETPGPDLQDEEVAGFAASTGETREDLAPSSTQELMRWQVRLFAMECLHDLIAMIGKEAAVSDEGPGKAALQAKVADVVRIAFSASTAGVTSLRVIGLRIVDQILQMFGHTPDPDFPEAMLLEQYQAQISSALTPAFAADSSPELAAEAINVCATFIATGIVTDIERMGRILKLLVSALDSFSQDTETASIGDLQALSSNAQVMVRMAVFSAWAELQIASAEQKYLVDVVNPHIAKLVPLWLTSLREYSRLRFEPDISAAATGSEAHGDVDTVYAALNRQTLLRFYQDSWLSLVDAIASLIDENSDFVFDALDEKSTQSPDALRKNQGINYREEPVAFFFVLFGLAFESLAVPGQSDDAVSTTQRNLEILQALKKILRPSVSGNAVYQEVIFAETMDLLDRMVLTESLGVQTIIVEIARNLCMVHPSSRQGQQAPANDDALSEDIEQLFELTRIIVLVLAGLIPGLTETPVSVRLETSEEAMNLVGTALQALVDVSEVFPSIIKTDLHATILHIFITVLGTGACQAAVVPQSLPIFRRFLMSITEGERTETQHQLRNALGRMLIILRNAQKRETEASLSCEKNTLLAITILLSTASNELPHDDPYVSRFAKELCESLEGPLTSRVAAGCMRTLMMANVSAGMFLTNAVTFLLTPSDLEGMDESKALMAQTLTMYASKLPQGQRPAAVTLFMRTLLGRAMKEGPKTHQETAGRLLELATADNGTFRAVVGALDGEEKSTLEQILKSAAGGKKKENDVAGHEPTIALKMDF